MQPTTTTPPCCKHGKGFNCRICWPTPPASPAPAPAPAPTFTFISDPGHGWLEVPFSLLVDLRIEQCISRYSYEAAPGTPGTPDSTKRWAYLEEDCDAPVFVAAWTRDRGMHPEVIERECKGDAFVRRLAPYPAAPGACERGAAVVREWHLKRGARFAADLAAAEWEPEPADYAERVQALIDKGATRSDAQGIVDAEILAASRKGA